MTEDRKTPPYTSASDLDRLFDRMRKIGDPGSVDTKWVSPFQLAEAQPEAVVSTLRWLGVIDKDGKSLRDWDELGNKRGETLARLVKAAYSDVFSSVDVVAADRQDLEGAFISCYSGGSPDRRIKCFLALGGHAGIETQVVQRRSKQSPAVSSA